MKDSFIRFLTYLGGICLLAGRAFSRLFPPPKITHIIKQMHTIGVSSFPVVAITGAFTGMVLAVQSYYQFHKISMETAVGVVVGLSMTNELGPVLTALMVAGRAGGAMAAEIATMKVTEQVDALSSLGADPVRYLVSPRLAAGLALVPLLTALAMFIGIAGGYAVGVYLKNIDSVFYVSNMLFYTSAYDVMCGIIKSVVFSFIIVTVSCYFGFEAKGGAEGVGSATTKAVVVSSISILISDFFMSLVLI